MYFVIRAYEEIYQGEEGKESITIEVAENEIMAEYVAHDLSIELMYDHDEIMDCIYDMANDIAREKGIEKPYQIIYDLIEDNINYDIYPIVAMSDIDVYNNYDELVEELEEDFEAFLNKYC